MHAHVQGSCVNDYVIIFKHLQIIFYMTKVLPHNKQAVCYLTSSSLEVSFSKSCRQRACWARFSRPFPHVCVSNPPVFAVEFFRSARLRLMHPPPTHLSFVSFRLLYPFCCHVLCLSTGFTLAANSLVLTDATAAAFYTPAPHSLALADAATAHCLHRLRCR